MKKRATNAANKGLPKARETVFLSGTDRVRDVLSQVYRALKRMGFKPWWFPQPDFPNLADNAMDACLAAARICSRFVLVLDERAGLRYPPTDTTITEAEFNEAHRRTIPCLVFIRAKIWYQSRAYHRCHAKFGNVEKQRFESMMLDGDQAVYEFIERIQHKIRGGKPAVPWITPFDLGDEIIRTIRGKWLMTDKDQRDALTALHRLAEETAAGGTPKTSRVGHIVVPNVVYKTMSHLSPEDLKHLAEALRTLQAGVAFDPTNPLNLEYVGVAAGKRQIMIAAGDLRVNLTLERPDRIIIRSIVRAP